MKPHTHLQHHGHHCPETLPVPQQASLLAQEAEEADPVRPCRSLGVFMAILLHSIKRKMGGEVNLDLNIFQIYCLVSIIEIPVGSFIIKIF